MKFKNILIAVLIAVTIALMPLLGGCKTSEQRIAELESGLNAAQLISTAADQQIQSITESLPALELTLSDPNLPAELRQQAIDAMNIAQAKLKSFQESKVKAHDAISKLQTAIAQTKELGDIEWTDELGIYGEGALIISKLLPPQVQGYVALGGIILSIVSQILGSKKKKENLQLKEKNSQSEKALDEVVTANEVFLKKSPQSWDAFKEAQDDIQTIATIQKVSTIKAS